MKFKVISLLLLCFTASLSRLCAVPLLPSFGTDDFTQFSTSGIFVATSNSATFSGSGVGVFLSGDFTQSVDISSIGVPTSIDLNLIFNSTYTGKIDLVIGSFNSSTFGSTSVSYSMSAVSLSGLQTIKFLRDANPAVGILNLSAINFATLTADNPDFALNTLSALATSAIPEPSTFAALFGAAALGLAACRRRRPAA